MIFPHVPIQQRRLLSRGKRVGLVPWIISILVLLTLLTTAIGLSFVRSAASVGDAIADKVTIEITTPDREVRLRHQQEIQQRLADAPYIRQARLVETETLLSTFDQWFSSTRSTDESPSAASDDSEDSASTVASTATSEAEALPLPALIDVAFHTDTDTDTASQSGDAEPIAQLRELVGAVTPHARVSTHASWLAPIVHFINVISGVAGAAVLLIIFVSCGVVIMSVRTALNAHSNTMEILHVLGATDGQISRLFQRRIAIDSCYGALLGALPALVIIGFMSSLLEEVTSGLSDTLVLGIGGWAILLSLPIVVIILSTLTARYALLAMLEKSYTQATEKP